MISLPSFGGDTKRLAGNQTGIPGARQTCLLAAAFLAATLGGQPVATPLQTGKTIERQLSDGEWHEHRLALQAGQYARITVQQHTIGVALSIFAPGGKEIFRADGGTIGDTKSAEFICDISGDYRVRLAPSEPHAPSGRYAITLQNVEPATEMHRERAAGSREYTSGMIAFRRGTVDGTREAADRLGRALIHWRAAGDHVEEVRSLVAITLVNAEAGNQKEAREYAAKLLPAAGDAHNPLSEARALDCLGQVEYYFGDKQKAIKYYEQALPLMRAAGDRAAEGSTLSNLSVAYSRTGDKRKALVLLNDALRIFQDLQDRRMVAEVVGNMGVTYDNLGEYQKALESHQRDLALKRELGDRADEAIAWNNIANAYTGLAEYQKSLDAYNAALEINRSTGKQSFAAINLNNIAWVYDQLADQQRALTFYQEALAIFRKVNDRMRTAAALNNIAEVYADLGDYRRAVELHQEALPLRRAGGDADGEANSLNNLGRTFARLGERDKARDYLLQALAKHRSGGNRHMMSRTLRGLGELECAAGDFASSRRYLDEALETSRAIHDPNGEATTLGDLAVLERKGGDLWAAHQRAEEAMAMLESVRLAVASPKLRATYFASARDVQELNIGVLMQLNARSPNAGFDAMALQASERGRARSLLEMLGEGTAEIRRGVDAALLDREKRLEQLISAKAGLQLKLLAGRHSEADAQSIARELDTLSVELEQVQSRIRGSSPQYAALTRPVPLRLEEIQAKVLDPDTLLLEYELGKEKSFLWAVTNSSLDVFELPSRETIEATGRRVYDLLTARNQTPAKETAAGRAARVKRTDAEYSAAAERASEMLVRPAASLLQNRRLLIVGEGILQYLPFAALPEPNAGAAVPMAVKHEIVIAPSASVLAVLREETAGRRHAEKALAVLADPVFSAADPRISRQKPEAAITAADRKVSRTGSGARGHEYNRLRFSRTEAEEIARLAPPESTLKALDFNASRETVMRSDLGQYRVVHFATHSLLDNQHPELSGIVLSLVDRFGRPQNGFLRLYEIYNLRLRSDLVVLSACQTALGGEIKGEGLIGLTRGFLYAGAPRVVATLWEIDDRTTAELMKQFYAGILTRGERPAAALRAAQLAMWRTKGWQAPYYWAAFTLYGEWR